MIEAPTWFRRAVESPFEEAFCARPVLRHLIQSEERLLLRPQYSIAPAAPRGPPV